MSARDRQTLAVFARTCQIAIGSAARRPRGAVPAAFIPLIDSIPPIEDPTTRLQLVSLLVRLAIRLTLLSGSSGHERALDTLCAAETHADIREAFRSVVHAIDANAGMHGNRDQDVSGHTIEPRNVRAQAALQFIRQNSANPNLRLSDVAREINLSRWHLDRLLVRETGVGFTNHLRAARLTHARRLLVDTQLSIKEIAFTVGYRYANELNRHFRVVHQSTPCHWRQTRMRSVGATDAHE
jgi:AraC-like DNA-binding protein